MKHLPDLRNGRGKRREKSGLSVKVYLIEKRAEIHSWLEASVFDWTCVGYGMSLPDGYLISLRGHVRRCQWR